MNYIKAIREDGQPVIFNLDNVLAITPHKSGDTTILMEPGCFWTIETASIRFIECRNALFSAIGCENPYGEGETS